MNFELSAEQQEIHERAAEFADREVAHAADLDREDRVPFETLEKLAEMGFMGLCVPEEYGGRGGLPLLRAADRGDQPRRRWCRRDARPHERGTLPIVMYGDEDQKARCRILLRETRSGPSPSPSPLQAPTRPRYRRPPSGSKAATGSRATSSGSRTAASPAP